MKKLISIFLFLPLVTFAQEKSDLKIFPEVNGVVDYTDVIKLDSSVKKDELFNRAKAWFIQNYKSAKDVIQMQDKDAGIIIGKGVFEFGFNPATLSDRTTIYVSHTIKIYVKDGKYKYEIGDLIGTYDGSIELPIGNYKQERNKRNYIKLCESTHEEILRTIESLEQGMQKPFIDKTDF